MPAAFAGKTEGIIEMGEAASATRIMVTKTGLFILLSH